MNANELIRFDPRITFWLCLVAIASVLPFAAYHFATDYMLMGVISLVVAVTAGGVSIAIRLLGYVPPWTLILTCLVGSSMALCAAYLTGVKGFVWSYPLVVFNFFLVGPRAGLAINGLFILGAGGTSVLWNNDIGFTVRALVTLMTLYIFAYVFSRYVSKQRRELAEAARTDSLTGAGNRRAMDEAMQDMRARYERYDQPAALILLDMDRFKRINDEHGHRRGDDVLTALTGLITGMIRKTDKLYRYGGEEFVVLMPSTSAIEAAQAAEKIRHAVENTALAGLGSLTMSAGVAEKHPNESEDNWLKRGDRALYQAKELGRNRVIVAEPAPHEKQA